MNLNPLLTWPASALEARSDITRIETGVLLRCPIGFAFAFTTTPAMWNSWHPATAAVRDAPHRALALGESVVETIRAGGRRFDATWTVLASEPDSLWVIGTRTARGDARIIYRLTENPGGCHFHRTLDYCSRGLPWRWLDGNLTRYLLGQQSHRAMDRLKTVLERSYRRL
jgi:hypothetical protein